MIKTIKLNENYNLFIEELQSGVFLIELHDNAKNKCTLLDSKTVIDVEVLNND